MSHKHKTLIAFQFLKITSSTDSFTYENPCKFLIIFFFSKVLIFLTGSMCLFSPISNVLITVIKNRLCNKQHEKCFNHEIVSVQTPHNTTYPIDSFPWTKRSTLNASTTWILLFIAMYPTKRWRLFTREYFPSANEPLRSVLLHVFMFTISFYSLVDDVKIR